VSDTPLLKVSDLIVEFPTRNGVLRPVDRVGFEVRAGEILGLVGESGAGKSMCGSAIIGLIDRPGRISGGEIHLDGERIDNLPEERMRRIRGKKIAMVFQDPLTSLNPLMTVGQQLIQTIRTHLALSQNDARAKAIALLEEVGIPAAATRIDAYPHQFSGGMRQRVVISLALAAEPELIIADEPTTALDVSVQAQIMALLKRLCRERGDCGNSDHPRHGRDSGNNRPCGCALCGPDRGNRAYAECFERTIASLHRRFDGLHTIDNRIVANAQPNPRLHAEPSGHSERLRIQSAVHQSHFGLFQRHSGTRTSEWQ
jgi:ABC-type dipeptide/oligopeptide/nickel transport system ATPase subunit